MHRRRPPPDAVIPLTHTGRRNLCGVVRPYANLPLPWRHPKRERKGASSATLPHFSLSPDPRNLSDSRAGSPVALAGSTCRKSSVLLSLAATAATVVTTHQALSGTSRRSREPMGPVVRFPEKLQVPKSIARPRAKESGAGMGRAVTKRGRYKASGEGEGPVSEKTN